MNVSSPAAHSLWLFLNSVCWVVARTVLLRAKVAAFFRGRTGAGYVRVFGWMVPVKKHLHQSNRQRRPCRILQRGEARRVFRFNCRKFSFWVCWVMASFPAMIASLAPLWFILLIQLSTWICYIENDHSLLEQHRTRLNAVTVNIITGVMWVVGRRYIRIRIPLGKLGWWWYSVHHRFQACDIAFIQQFGKLYFLVIRKRDHDLSQ